MQCAYVRTHPISLHLHHHYPEPISQSPPSPCYIKPPRLGAVSQSNYLTTISEVCNSFLFPVSCFLFFLFLLSSPRETRADDKKKNNRVYIVYMGATTSSDGSYRYDHALIMTFVLKRFFLLLILTRINTRMCVHIYSLFVILIPLVIIFYIISDNLMELSLAYYENTKAR